MADLLKILWAEQKPFLSSLSHGFWGRDVVEVGPPAPFAKLSERVRWGAPSIVLAVLKGVDANELERFIEQLMAEHPVPVLLLASAGAQRQVALSGLAAGALDVMELPANPDGDFWRLLRRQLDLLVQVRVAPGTRRKRKPRPTPRHDLKQTTPLVAIAASLGGPKAVRVLLAALPARFPAPIAICQHITSGFTQDLARWLTVETQRKVVEATAGATLEPGTVYIAPSDAHFVVRPGRLIELDHSPPVGGFRPSCDVLLKSAAQAYASQAIGVVLTGMGRDGAQGLSEIRKAGGHTVAQDQASSAVFGMPQEAIALKAAEKVLPLTQIAAQLKEWVGA